MANHLPESYYDEPCRPRQTFGTIAVFLALLDINLGNMLYFGHPAARIASCFLGVILLASLVQTNWQVWKRNLWTASILTAAGFAWVVLSLDSKEAGFIGLVCALGCLTIPGPGKDIEGHIPVFMTATGLVALFDYGYSHTSLIWYGVKQANHLMMRLIEIVTGQPMPFGHHASGFFLLVPFVGYLAALILHAHRPGKSKPAGKLIIAGIFTLFIILVCQALYLIGHQTILSRIQFRAYQTLFRLTPFETHWLAFLIFLVPFSLYRRRLTVLSALTGSATPQDKRKKSLRFSVKWLTALVFILLVSLPLGNRWRIFHPLPSRGKTVLIYDNLDWSVPEFGNYGHRSGGMFGNLPDFLTSLGYSVRLSRELGEAGLSDVDLLVIINLMERLDQPAREAVHRYVAAGGSLLVMGDHTGFGFIREPFNDLLQPAAISFRFDSARSLIPSWQNCMEIRPHRITEHLARESDVQIWTGASLETRYPARPVLIGVRAFSDAGNKANGQDGFLGDLQYGKSEWLGDVVLAAEARVGQGKVLVFGDTSSLQNGSLPYCRQFIQDMFFWLMEKPGPGPEIGRHIHRILWFFFLLLLALLWYEHSSAAVLWLVCALYLFQAPVRLFPQPDHPPRSTEKARIAYIDNSHGEYFDVTGWQKNSIDGLAYNLMRNHYAPFIASVLDPALVNNSAMWVFISPTRRFSPKEVRILHRFMAQGGTIVWSAGWMVRESSLSFLKGLGLSFINLPLGPVRESYGEHEVRFQDVWPVRIDGQVRGRTSVLVQKYGYPLAVFQRYGRGGILLISDSRFLLNQNLENIDNFYHEGNILFLRDALKKISRGWAG
ncbi:MAG: DUF4350 domain-containing protein [bacterium]